MNRTPREESLMIRGTLIQFSSSGANASTIAYRPATCVRNTSFSRWSGVPPGYRTGCGIGDFPRQLQRTDYPVEHAWKRYQAVVNQFGSDAAVYFTAKLITSKFRHLISSFTADDESDRLVCRHVEGPPLSSCLMMKHMTPLPHLHICHQIACMLGPFSHDTFVAIIAMLMLMSGNSLSLL